MNKIIIEISTGDLPEQVSSQIRKDVLAVANELAVDIVNATGAKVSVIEEE